MAERITERLKCPFYRNVVRSKRMIGLECEALSTEESLGFRITNVMRFRTYADLRDFAEIFCCDMWKSCPYGRAVMDEKYAD